MAARMLKIGAIASALFIVGGVWCLAGVSNRQSGTVSAPSAAETKTERLVSGPENEGGDSAVPPTEGSILNSVFVAGTSPHEDQIEELVTLFDIVGHIEGVTPDSDPMRGVP